MSNIKDLIKELCPNGVEYKKLDDCCKILDNKRKPVKKGERSIGEYPYYGANGIQDYVSDYIFDGTFVLVGEDGSVITDRGTPVVNWAVGKIWVNNHAHIISEKNNILIRYIYHYLQTIDVSDYIHGNIPKLNQTDFRNLKIAVPPLEVQEEIVRILDKFGALEAELETELETELEARESQYEFWCGKLLNKKRNIKISEYFTRLKGTPITAGKMKEIEVENGEVRIFAGGQTKVDTSRDYIPKEDIINVPSVVIQSRGLINFIYYDRPFSFKNEMWAYTCENPITVKYLYYYLKNNVDYFRMIGGQMGSMPQISLSVTENFDIFLPSIEEQEKIVNILDKFEKKVNILEEGLPAEIELRKKQYEYYRNKLLDFRSLKDEI